MKKDAFYFPHFEGARNDRKILRLRKEFGTDGYCAYFMLLEVLRAESNFSYPLQDIDLLAKDFEIGEGVIKSTILNFGLFDIDEEQMVFSPKFNQYMQPYLNMKAQRIAAAQKSVEARKKKTIFLNEPQTTVERPLNETQTTVQHPLNKEKKSKEKESKEKEDKSSKAIAIPSIFSSQNFTDAFEGFEQMRKSMKKPLTENAKNLLLKKLESLANGNEQVAIKILENSTMNSWQSVFALKEEDKPKPQKPSNPAQEEYFVYL
jgi:hypothetical protein